MSEPKIHLVLAGNYRQFLTWCRQYNQSPHNRYIRYVSRPEQLFGYKGEDVVIITTGTWPFERPTGRMHEWTQELKILTATGAERKHMRT